MRLMIAYFTRAAVVASQLAGAAHQGFSRSQRKKTNKQRQSSRRLQDASRREVAPAGATSRSSAAAASRLPSSDLEKDSEGEAMLSVSR